MSLRPSAVGFFGLLYELALLCLSWSYSLNFSEKILLPKIHLIGALYQGSAEF
jgi:hypothetical protein